MGLDWLETALPPYLSERVSFYVGSELSGCCEIMLCWCSVSLIVLEVPMPPCPPFVFRLFCSLCTYWLKRAYFLAESCCFELICDWLTMFWALLCELYCCLPLWIPVAVALPCTYCFPPVV